MILTSINNHNSSKNIVVFPNPICNEINIKYIGKEKPLVQLFSMNGEIIYNRRITFANTKISMKGYPSGVYNLVITQKNRRESFKVIKN